MKSVGVALQGSTCRAAEFAFLGRFLAVTGHNRKIVSWCDIIMKSFLAKNETVEHNWRLVDADGEILGRMAVKIAMALMGKDKPIYTPHVDTGDFVIVVNAEKIRLTGDKADTKEYQRYSQYPGGQKIVSFGKMMETHPERVVELAVRRMLPKNKLGAKMLKKLKVYSGPDHNHAAQQPVKMEL